MCCRCCVRLCGQCSDCAGVARVAFRIVRRDPFDDRLKVPTDILDEIKTFTESVFSAAELTPLAFLSDSVREQWPDHNPCGMATRNRLKDLLKELKGDDADRPAVILMVGLLVFHGLVRRGSRGPESFDVDTVLDMDWDSLDIVVPAPITDSEESDAALLSDAAFDEFLCVMSSPDPLIDYAVALRAAVQCWKNEGDNSSDKSIQAKIPEAARWLYKLLEDTGMMGSHTHEMMWLIQRGGHDAHQQAA